MSSRRLECAEIWAGSERTASLLNLPGLVAWVSSTPAGPGDAGGDVHYVSVCPSCVVCRVALADVSGHGQAVKAVAEKVRELMQRYLPALEQGELMRDLNLAVGLMGVMRGLDPSSAEAFGLGLRTARRAFRGGGEPADDETIIVLQRVDTLR